MSENNKPQPAVEFRVVDSSPASLHKTSVVVLGPTEAIVVDAAFTRADGHRIVAEVLDSGRRLTAVLLTGGDPDFYFGAEVIADAFPDARVMAPANVVQHIDASFTHKLEAWAHLGANLPTRLVDIDVLDDDSITVDGVELLLRPGSEVLAERAWYLWEPRTRVSTCAGSTSWSTRAPTGARSRRGCSRRTPATGLRLRRRSAPRWSPAR